LPCPTGREKKMGGGKKKKRRFRKGEEDLKLHNRDSDKKVFGRARNREIKTGEKGV